MRDDSLRSLGSAPGQRVAALGASLRGGALREDDLRFAAYLGDEEARALLVDLGRPLEVPEGDDEWLWGLRAFGELSWLRALAACVADHFDSKAAEMEDMCEGMGKEVLVSKQAFLDGLKPWLEAPFDDARLVRFLEVSEGGARNYSQCGVQELFYYAAHYARDAELMSDFLSSDLERLKSFGSDWLDEEASLRWGASNCLEVSVGGDPEYLAAAERAQLDEYAIAIDRSRIRMRKLVRAELSRGLPGLLS